MAALDDDVLLGQIELDPQQRTTQTLAPAIVTQLQAVGWQPSDLQLLVVTQGPGSFTGLRVGVTTAKTLAYAVGAQIIGLNTLEVIAAQAPDDQIHATSLWAVIDARRQQLFAARFQQTRDGLPPATKPTHLVDKARWLAGLQPGDLVTGPGLEGLQPLLPEGITAVKRGLWSPMASTVGRLGYRHFQAGRRDDVWKLAPLYFRKSAAEEKLSGGGSA